MLPVYNTKSVTFNYPIREISSLAFEWNLFREKCLSLRITRFKRDFEMSNQYRFILLEFDVE